MRARALLTRVAVTVLQLGLLGRGAKAQDVPTVFLHGFGSSGATWQLVSDQLASQYTIGVTRPTIGKVTIFAGITLPGGFASLSNQASELQGYLPNPGYALVGHSMGGLVARELVLQRSNAGQPQLINRLLTVSTPHKGAPLAASVVGGRLRPIDQSVLIMNDMLPWYGVVGEDISPFYKMAWGPFTQQMVVSHQGVSTDVRFWIPLFAPATLDLTPTNPHYRVLNDSVQIHREDAIDRVSIVGLTTNDALFFKGVLPLLEPSSSPSGIRADAQLFDKYRRDLRDALLTAALIISLKDFLYYSKNGLPPCFNPNTLRQYNFQTCIDAASPLVQLLGAAYVVDNLNNFWRKWIGAREDNTSDAVLPDSTQFYPFLSTTRRLSMADTYHGLETREASQVVANVLSTFWHIPVRQPPTPPPLANSIAVSGFNYTAYPTGGTPPYTFLWEWFRTPCPGGGGGGLNIAFMPLRGNLAQLPQGQGQKGPEPIALGTRSGSSDSLDGLDRKLWRRGRVPTPNLTACGWQQLSTAQTVYWDQSQSSLRSTVTDATGAQSVAVINVP